MRNIQWIPFIVLQFILIKISIGQVTVFPHGLSQRTLQVHDSISPFTEFKLTHGINTGQGIKMRLYSLGEADIHNRLGDLILKAGATGPGAHMVLEEFGNIGIGYPRFSATHALHINDVNPLRLQGLTNCLMYDTVLVVSPTGVIHKRAQSTFPASYWTKSGNYVFNLTDSIGIGVDIPTERLYVKDAMKIGTYAEVARLKLESVFINSEFGQYKFGTSELLLDGILPASGLTYLNAKKGSSDVVTSQGLLLNVEAARPIIFATNEREAMRIDSNGYLGIGTKIPTEPLSVDSSMIVGDIIKLGFFNHIQLGEYGASEPSANDINIHAIDDIQFVSFLKTQMVDPRDTGVVWAEFNNFTHRFGIDTINPRYPLHVNGKASIEDTLYAETIQLGALNKRFLTADGGGIKIQNNSPFTDSRSNVSLKNGQGHFLVLDDDNINFINHSFNYVRFDGANRSLSINSSLVTPRETLDVVGSAIVEDTIRISGFDKLISGKGGALEITSDEPINITADLSSVTISDGIFPYAIFEGSTRNFGLLNSGPVKKKLEVGGSGFFHDSLFIKTLENTISSTGFDHLKIESGNDVIIASASNNDVIIQNGGSNLATFKGSTERVGIGTASPQEKLDVNGTIETDKIKITDGAIPGRVLVSDGNGLGSWSTVPPDGDWIITGPDMQAGIPGNIQVGFGIVQNSKWNVNGSIAQPINIVSGPTYMLTNMDYSVILIDPSSVMATLPAANTCPGRIYRIKFLTPGGSLLTSTAADLIDNVPMTFAVPPPSFGIATTIVIQSDGGNGWWIIN